MARGRKPKLTVVGGPQQAGPGHNSELTEDQQLRLLKHHTSKITSIKEQLASLTGQLRSQYKEAKADGFPKKDIDFAIDIQKDNDDAMLERRRRETFLARILNHPIGTQFELFDNDPRPITDRAFEEGKQAGLDGKDASPPYDPSTEAYGAWMKGWHAGQAILAERFQPGPAAAEVLREEDKATEKKVDDFDTAASE